MGQRIAIVGSGISGLGAAWALHRNHEVVVFEADDRIGGHSHTVDVQAPSAAVPVDTGFIVYNEVTYPNLTRLFSALDVPTEHSDMSFSCSVGGEFEYGASLRGVLAQPSNLMRSRFRRMLLDINRFRRMGGTLRPGDNETIEELLVRNGFSQGFLEDYLLPMTGAIWSARQSQMKRFPARAILRFLSNHGLVEIVGRPRWRTVSGGSRSYVTRLAAPFADRIRLETPVTRLVRNGHEVTVETPQSCEMYDHVVLATHSDQALRILGEDATSEERSCLGAIRYEPNAAVLHSDPALMPRRKAVWSSWNTFLQRETRDAEVASVTYWMNRLQNLDPAFPLFMSLNPPRDPDPELVHGRFEYSHPQFNSDAISAQQGLAAIQGINRTWFAGAYMGYGFHEDGLQSGLNVAAALGSPSPWHGTFEPVSSAPEPASSGGAL